MVFGDKPKRRRSDRRPAADKTRKPCPKGCGFNIDSNPLSISRAMHLVTCDGPSPRRDRRL